MVRTLGSECDRGGHWENLVGPYTAEMQSTPFSEQQLTIIVANSMACAIREAYAAALNVVILVDDQAAYYTD